MSGDIAGLRREYADEGLTEADLAADPVTMFGRWFDDAAAAGLHEPNAMVLATADAEGRPSSRMVLLKGVDERGFVFYTNRASRKGVELAANPACALLFPWHPLERQVRVDGTVRLLDRAAVADYFARRPRGSQIGAHASHQSRPVADRAELAAAYDELTARFEGAGRAGARGVGRLPRGPRGRRVLAGATRPDARPARLPAYRRRLDHRTTRSLNPLSGSGLDDLPWSDTGKEVVQRMNSSRTREVAAR